MDKNTILLFTRNGMGDAPQELQEDLVTKFFALTLESGNLPAKIVFYTDGVKLCCTGSPVISQLKTMEAAGVELVLCSTCLAFFGIEDQVEIGVVGGMGDILTAIQMAPKVVSI